MAFNGDGPHSKRQRTETDSANNRGYNASTEEPRRKRPEEGKPNHVLLFTIINPMYPITVDVLHTICQSSGQVLRIVIFKKNGVQAMVEFDSVEAAVRAKETLNGADIYSGCCTLKIDFAKRFFCLCTEKDLAIIEKLQQLGESRSDNYFDGYLPLPTLNNKSKFLNCIPLIDL